MHTNKPQLRLLAVIICFAAILWLAAACGNGAFKDPSTLCETNSSAEGETMTATPEITEERILEVRDKYRSLFRRQPNYQGNGPSDLRDENGERTETRGIIIYVTKKVDQGALPAEDRIPDCLEDVPVQIVEEARNILLSESLEGTDEEETNDQN